MGDLPPRLVPGGAPFLLPGNRTACLLIHGFTAMPEEMRLLGDHLAGQGHTVLGVRLAGHGTHPEDLARTRWTDWLTTVEDGLAVVERLSERVVLIGQSLGGMIALTSAASYRVAGVVAMSTPFGGHPPVRWRLGSRLPGLRRKPVAAHPELGLEREADYPAYVAAPRRIEREVAGLHAALGRALPSIEVPVLVIQSRADPWVSADAAESIHARLERADRRLLLVDGLGHSIALDPERAEVFRAVGAFVAELGGVATAGRDVYDPSKA